jgi:hypothetical protein
MFFARSPKPCQISKDDQNWRKLYALCFVYLTAIVVVNWYRWRVHAPPIALPSVSISRASQLRPTLFKRLPSVNELRNAVSIIDPSLRFLLNATENGVLDHARKNPCWLLEGQLKCLPYFYVLGSFQGGIRDLEAKMLRHPDIVRALPPEPHFWSELKPAAEYINQLSKAYRRHPNADLEAKQAVLGCVPTCAAVRFWHGSTRLWEHQSH